MFTQYYYQSISVSINSNNKKYIKKQQFTKYSKFNKQNLNTSTFKVKITLKYKIIPQECEEAKLLLMF